VSSAAARAVAMKRSSALPRPLAVLFRFVLRVVARMRAIGLARTAASLAFTTLLAMVPLATVAIAFVAHFPVFERWLDTLELFLLKRPGNIG